MITLLNVGAEDSGLCGAQTLSRQTFRESCYQQSKKMLNSDDCGRGIKVYRFQPCYEVGGGLRAQKISSETLWFSTPKNLNDPMDIDHPLDDLMRGNGGDSPLLRSMAKLMYAPEQEKYPRELITQDLRQHIQHWSENGGHSLDVCREFRERLLQLGVACFTPNWDSPPMWAHYAENWKGFAIEYCVRQMGMVCANENSLLWQFWVNYGSSIQQTSLSELLCSPYEAVSRILSAKTLPWSYEKEWRLIHLGGGDQAVRIPSGMQMTGIVLGPKSPCEQSKFFAEKCDEWSLPLRRVNVGLDRTLRLHDVS